MWKRLIGWLDDWPCRCESSYEVIAELQPAGRTCHRDKALRLARWLERRVLR